MRGYRFNLCDIDGRIIDIRERACADDLEALEQAVEIWKDYIIEIRESGTFVARVKPGDLPLNEKDLPSLVYPREAITPPVRTISHLPAGVKRRRRSYAD